MFHLIDIHTNHDFFIAVTTRKLVRLRRVKSQSNANRVWLFARLTLQPITIDQREPHYHASKNVIGLEARMI